MQTQPDYRQLYNSMLEAFDAVKLDYFVVEVLRDAKGNAFDVVYREVSPATEKLIGKSKEQIIGKRRKELFGNVNDEFLEKFDNVVKTGKPDHFESYGARLSKNYDVYAWKVGQNQVAVILTDITEKKEAADALKASEENYRLLLQYAPTAIYEIDYKNQLFKSVNDAMCKMTGYSREELLAMNPSDLLDSESRERFKKRIKRGLAGQKIDENVEFRAIVKDGRELWITLNIKLMYKDGKLDSALVVGHDITERKKAEESLRKLNRHLRAISNSNQALMHVADEAKFTQEVCDIIVKDCGYALVWVGLAENDKEKSVRPVAFSGFDKEYIDALRITWDGKSERGRGPTGTVIRTGKLYVCNMRSDLNFEPWRQDAKKRGYTASLVLPLTSFEGKPFGALNIYSLESNPFDEEEIKLLSELSSDFAYGIMMLRLRKEREQAEKTLQKQASLIDLSPDAVIVKKLDDTITFWSEGAEKLYGWTKEEAVGKKATLLFKTSYPEPPQKILGELQTSGRWSGENIHKTKLGNKVVVQSRWLAECGAKGEILEILETNEDITLRKQMQTKLEEYAKNLEGLVEERTKALKDSERLAAIGATAGMVGHDIRNPLQAITSDVFLLKSELASVPESEEKKNAFESLDEIEKNIDYINKIVQDLQDYA